MPTVIGPKVSTRFFDMVSEWTHKGITFTLEGVDMNGDEIAGWRYTSYSVEPPIRVLIVND